MALSPKTTWVGIIVGLLSLSMIANFVVLFVYAGVPSETLEEDWEGRNENWNAIQAQERTNRDLGWTIQATAWEILAGDGASVAEAPQRRVELLLRDRAGSPLSGAQIQWKAFATVRPDLRMAGTAEVGDASGTYWVHLPLAALDQAEVSRECPIEFRIELVHEGQSFTHTWIEKPKPVTPAPPVPGQ